MDTAKVIHLSSRSVREDNHGHVMPTYRVLRRYTELRLRRWLMRREQRYGTEYKRYPSAYLYQTLGLYTIPTRWAAVLNAKA